MKASKVSYLAIAFLLIAGQLVAGAAAQSTVVSGSFVVTNRNPNGTSMYTVDYRYPSAVTVGANLTVTVTLEVNELSGLKLYLDNYSAYVTLFDASGHFLATKGLAANVYTTVSALTQTRYLYPGSHWGPVNVTVPVLASATGLAPGQSELGNLSIAIFTSVWYDHPVSTHYVETGNKEVGTLNLTRPQSVAVPAPFPTLVVLGVIGAVAVVAVVALVLLRRKTPDLKSD